MTYGEKVALIAFLFGVSVGIILGAIIGEYT